MEPAFIPYNGFSFSEEETFDRSKAYHDLFQSRRSIRQFSSKPVQREVIENIIMTASSAPSGAHKQPWIFCAVADPGIKREIRRAAEKEEYLNYHGRMSEEWLADLLFLGTDWRKPFLETAPWLIVVFKQIYPDHAANKKKHYYVTESVGLACGFLLSAVHYSGLVALTHTPSPMNFLEKILNRPENERAFLLIPVGFPADDAVVPAIKRKSLNEVTQWIE